MFARLCARVTRRVLERARRRGQRPRLLFFYARVEAGIGVYALLFPILFGFAQKLSLLGPLVEARRQTTLFLNHYNHVVPFDRRALEAVWSRCGSEDCEVERARAEKLLWGLDGSATQ